MEYWESIGLFVSQALIIVISIIAVIVTIAAVAGKNKNSTSYNVEVLNDNFDDQAFELKSAILSPDLLKIEKKNQKKAAKETKNTEKPYVYVLDFLDGDVQASGVDQLREEITTLLLIAKKGEEVIVNVESPGGVVHGYGLAAAQLLRLREFGLNVTICVDKVAASGGYMMAVTGHQIICAPFAIVGSIGVVAAIPNFYKALKKHDVEYKEYTAGDYKRTVSMFGEITEKGERKFHEQLEATHALFKRFVGAYRPQLDLANVTTGEYWFGQDALKLQLVDVIGTSDEYILNKVRTHTVVKITQEKKESFKEKISNMFAAVAGAVVQKSFERFETTTHKKNTLTQS